MIAAPADAISRQWTLLRSSAVRAEVWRDLARAYAARGLPWQAGYAGRQALRLDESLAPQLQALDLGPWQDATAADALLERAELPEAAALAERFFATLNESPGDWLSWLYLARLQELRRVPGAGCGE